MHNPIKYMLSKAPLPQIQLQLLLKSNNYKTNFWYPTFFFLKDHTLIIIQKRHTWIKVVENRQPPVSKKLYLLGTFATIIKYQRSLNPRGRFCLSKIIRDHTSLRPFPNNTHTHTHVFVSGRAHMFLLHKLYFK